MSEVVVQPDAQAPAAVEWDHKGRVTSSRFKNGQLSQFRYDTFGNLYAFTYGRLAWSTTDGATWTAEDAGSIYIVQGTISAAQDGTLKIRKQNCVRTLKLNGNILDEHDDGSVLESVRTNGEASAADLFATVQSKQLHSSVSSVYFEPEHLRTQPPQPVPPPPAKAEPPVIEELTQETEGRRGLAGGIRLKRLRIPDVVEPPTPSTMEVLSTAFTAKCAEYAVKLIEAVRGPKCIAAAPFLDTLASIAHEQRRVDEARVLHERALEIRKQTFGPTHADLTINLHGLGRIYHEWGRFTEAEHYLLDAVKVAEKGLKKSRFLLATGSVGERHTIEHLRRLVSSLHSLAALYHEQKKQQLCEKICDGALAACDTLEPHYKQAVLPLLESMSAMSAQLTLEPNVNRRLGRLAT